MFRYVPVAAVRPTPVASRLGRIERPSMAGPSRPALGQTFDEMFGWSPAMGDAVRLLFHGATTYLGIHVGITQTGFLKWMGWLLAAGQSIGAVCDVVSLVKRAAGTHPPEGVKDSCPRI
jgi:hypothetical protein